MGREALRIGVTGAGGFIGSTLVDRLLAGGHTVAGLDSMTPFYDPARKWQNLAAASAHAAFELTLADVRRPGVMERWLLDAEPDVVIHLAAEPGVPNSFADPAHTWDVNVGGTEAVVDALVAHGGVRLVLASSSSVYGAAEGPMAESDPLPAVESPYAKSKQAAEELVQLAHVQHGLDVCVVRPFSVIGPRQRPDLVLARFIAAARAGEPVTLFGDGEVRRDFTDVDDVAAIFEAAALRGWGHQVLNAGAGRSVSLLALLDALEAALGRSVPRQHSAGRAGDVRHTEASRAWVSTVFPGLSVTPLAESVRRQLSA